MKLFKLIILLVIIFGVLIFIYFLAQNKSFNPVSVQNDFYSKLNLGIQTSQLKISQFSIHDFNDEIEFYLIDGDNQIKTFFSTKKDPYWQIYSLQEILKTAKIKDKKLKLVDLSSIHPYVTFKNN
jgi:hypothetical protein